VKNEKVGEEKTGKRSEEVVFGGLREGIDWMKLWFVVLTPSLLSG